MKTNALPLVRRLFARPEERQPLIPREGPTSLQSFYRTLGRCKARANVPGRLSTWLKSKWSGYAPIADEPSEERDEAEGRKLFRAAMGSALSAIPVAGPWLNAVDTEGQAAKLWKIAQTMPDSAPSKDAAGAIVPPLKDVIETIALLKEAKATGQALAAPISLSALLTGPLAAMVGEKLAKEAVKRIVPLLSQTILSADRDQLAHVLHAAARGVVTEDGEPPSPQESANQRYALEAFAVLRVDPVVLNQGGEYSGYRDVRAAID